MAKVPPSAPNANALLQEVVQLYVQAQKDMADCCSEATAKECAALLQLGQGDPLTVQAFAGRMNLEKTWASRLLTRLEKRGLIERIDNPADGRSLLIKLTGKGRKEHDTVHRTLHDYAVDLMCCLPASERANVERSLLHLRDALATCVHRAGTGKPVRC